MAVINIDLANPNWMGKKITIEDEDLHKNINKFDESIDQSYKIEKSKDIKLSTKAIIKDLSGKILILKDKYSDYWDLPGGHVADEETVKEGLKREVKEETGLDIIESNEYMTKEITLGKETKPVTFFEVRADGDIKLSTEHIDYKWIESRDIDYYNLGKFSEVLKDCCNKLEKQILTSPDPYTVLYYDWVDDIIDKSGLVIPGDHPWGSKKIGKQLEAGLYDSLVEKIDEYLKTLTPDTSQTEAVNGVMDIIKDWQETVSEKVSQGFEDLYLRGMTAGIVDSGVKPTWGLADKLSLEFIKQNPNAIGSRIKIFSQNLIEKIRPIISNSYSPEGVFDVNYLTNELNKVAPAERYKLERIVRTETASVSNAGRLLGWSKDPDKYYYNYQWNATKDNRTKPISTWRMRQNPLTFEEVLFLWEHQEQNIGGKVYNDVFNQRCAISRSPRDDEFNGNRFERDVNFNRTMSLGIS